MLLFATQSSIRSQPPTSFSPTRVPLSVSEPTSVPPLGLTYEAGLEKHFGAKEPLLAKLDLSAVRQQAFLCVGRCGGFHSLLVKVQSHVAVFLFQVPDGLLVPWGRGTGLGGSGKGQEPGPHMRFLPGSICPETQPLAGGGRAPLQLFLPSPPDLQAVLGPGLWRRR